MRRAVHVFSASCVALVLVSGPAGVGALERADSRAAPDGIASADVPFSPTVPDVVVLDQNGRELRFHSLIRDKTVAINFIFTSCTTICPPLTTAMRAIQRQLADRVGRDIQLISMSVDPAVDRPERLQAFAAAFGAGPGWTFVTGSKANVDRLLKAFGSYNGYISAHSTTMLIGDARTNRWTRSDGLAPLATNVKLILDAAAAAGRARE